jgi:hypothetical protein
MLETLAFAALMLWVVFAFDAAAEPSRYSKAHNRPARLTIRNIAVSTVSKLRRCVLVWIRTGTA